MKRIAIIGGGPKAAALCAKAYCVNRFGRAVELRVFEKSRLGAAWSGSHGYSDGKQRLCTPAERDVGFPYERGLLDADGVQELLGRFSWHAFLVSRSGKSENHRDWVDRGRKPPTHDLYGQYIRWVINNSDQKTTRGTVELIYRKDRKWAIDYVATASKRSYTSKGFDGVVVTGPGPARRGFSRPEDPRITDGVAFWLDPKDFISQYCDLEEPIIIAGSGGTAAAIASWVTRNDESERPIIIIGNQGALFTRTESFFENALFSDEQAWASLEPEERINVSRRLNRGVVWTSVSDTLSQALNVRFRPGRVTSAQIEKARRGHLDELWVDVTDAKGARRYPASLLVDAAGFDPWWFTDVLTPRRARSLRLVGTKNAGAHRERLMEAMKDDLSLDIGAPGFHAPMLSQAQGPGFGSLMVLGAMSERILRTYVDPAMEGD